LVACCNGLEIDVNHPLNALESLEASALKLNTADRSRLLERLLASLDADAEVEQAWNALADQREAELDNGAAVAVPADAALARLRARLPR
jgi:hypothetical protein